MKYAHYNELNGELLGWYDSEIHTTIPTPNIEVDDTTWQEAIDNNYNFVNSTTSTLATKDFRTDEELLVEQQRVLASALKTLLDTAAQQYKWDSMQSARAATVPIKDTDSDAVKAMKTNAEALTDWYYNVWAIASQIQIDIDAGTREIPTVEDYLTELGTFSE